LSVRLAAVRTKLERTGKCLSWKRPDKRGRTSARSPLGKLEITKEEESFMLTLETPNGKWIDLGSSDSRLMLQLLAEKWIKAALHAARESG
jgi:hypothetical protein